MKEEKNIIKKTATIAFVSLLLSLHFIPLAIANPNDKAGLSTDTDITFGSSTTTTLWINGDQVIEGFKITQMEWDETILHLNSITKGYFGEEIWDTGTIDNSDGQLTNVQAGNFYSTTSNNVTGCTFSFSPQQVGTTTIKLIDFSLSSNGEPFDDLTIYNTTVTVHPQVGTLSASPYMPYQTNLSFVAGNGGSYNVIRASQSSPPTTPTSGIEVYNGTEETCTHTDLSGGETWHYSKWTYDISTGIFSESYQTTSVTTPITKIGAEASAMTINTDRNITIWLDGAIEIGGFKIDYINFTSSSMTVNEISAGWWDWLWNTEYIINNAEGYIQGIQAASQDTTDENQTAVNINTTLDRVGTCVISFSGTQASPDGQSFADCENIDSSFTIHPAAPTITASQNGTDSIDLTFSPGTGAEQIVIRGSTSSYPGSPSSGTAVYSGSGTSTTHTGLDPEQQWYYTAFSFNSTESLYSLTGTQATAITMTDNRPPEIGDPSPANGSSGQSTSFTWVVSITDPDGDIFDYTMECSDGQTKSASDESNGTKFFSLSSLDLATEYTIWVNVTDGTNSTGEWFTFTTQTNASGGVSGGGVSVIDIMVPNDATVEYDDIRFLIKLINPDTGNPKTGSRLDIDVNIAYINGTSIVSEAHPDEMGNGLYLYEIDYDIGVDDFIAWATYDYDGTEYMDAQIFKVKWNVYNNFSRLTERVGEVIYLFQYGQQNQTRMLSYKINQIQTGMNDITVEVEEQTLGQRLTNIAIDSVLQVLLMTSILTIILVLGGLIWGQRKTRRLVRTATVPANAAQKIVFGSEPVYSRPTRNIKQSKPSRPPDSRPAPQ